MNVFYEESGSFKVGSIVSKSDASFQVDTQHGKRAKIKAANIILEFSSPLDTFLTEADGLSAEIDLDFLWECCGSDEFAYEDLAREYWGHSPSAVEAAAIVERLSGAPMYFYKKGKGRFKAAPEEALKAALAGLERKKREQEQITAWADELAAGRLPEPIGRQLMALLFRPDKNALEYKAFEQACKQTALPPLRLADRVGGIPSVPEYLLAGFLMEYFPNGTGFHLSEPPTPVAADELPLADVRAFSIDDAATTEIDDALSLTPLANGNARVGIHIAAPTLGIAVGSALEHTVYSRLSTVYFPGDKITMLPDDVVQSFTLSEGQNCPALSLYVEVTPDFEPVAFENRIELVPIAANLRHAELEKHFNEETLVNDPGVDYPFKHELTWLWHFANALEKRRGKYDPLRVQPVDYNFAIDDGKVRITPRKRGAPMDKLVSELMILANSEWGRMLGEAGIPGLYRAQTLGKVRMTTRPEPHTGLGVAQYAWSTSPLRRAADFVNQRQLMAMIRGEKAPFEQNDAMLFGILRDFDAAYSAYLGFQDRMEYFWCLRWFGQEGISEVTAVYLKDDLVRVDGVPLRLRVGGMPDMAAGTRVRLAIARIDELMQEIECRYLGQVEGEQRPADDDDEG
ncbi:MAG: RNB domain-containing ribonuclease [Paludibacterium sp.]|uniref:ribonuclease catalytic domain-containing protein n=1 Tax=Paludibacterium sp. TaxID=1917523 RepID=UPI0025D9BB24|nr:RNB domain-containing ribonuclease [Paludibacterium sp.]MBV8046813.1 RNB domain-containing ribonuclease [Paludibacterium sp.]MBV8649335.1 RNB domain-containing ribonuclease [Paludibacterium sp.]